jgi:site-specific DNA-adenine methylase
MVNRGFYPNNITMVDKSPWGLFWKTIGDKTFSTEVFKYYLNDIPKDVSKIQSYMKGLSQVPVYNTQIDIPYIFLMLQASAFGSKSIWINNEKWQNCSFRGYWLPTETSNRRSPVNPMMPMPDTLYDRVEKLSIAMEGVNGFYGDCNDIKIEPNSIIYIDPPYSKTTKYGYDFDYMSFINTYKETNTIFLSEGKQLSDIAFNLTDRRNKGGISGNKTHINEEWLNVFNVKR